MNSIVLAFVAIMLFDLFTLQKYCPSSPRALIYVKRYSLGKKKYFSWAKDLLLSLGRSTTFCWEKYFSQVRGILASVRGSLALEFLAPF